MKTTLVYLNHNLKLFFSLNWTLIILKAVLDGKISVQENSNFHLEFFKKECFSSI